MLNKIENNIGNGNPCSKEGLIAVKDNDGNTHIIQRELISHTEDASDTEGEEATTVYFVSGRWIRVFLSPEKLAKKLSINVSD